MKYFVQSNGTTSGLDVTVEDDNNYVPFALENFVDNPVALARINAHLTQKELAVRMGVTQAYISKAERQDRVTPKLLARIQHALNP